MIGSIHRDAKKTVAFENVSEKAKIIYLGLVADRYEQNKDKIDADYIKSNEPYLKKHYAPRMRLLHTERKAQEKKLIKEHKKRLPSKLPSDLIKMQETLFGEEENIRVPHNTPEVSVSNLPGMVSPVSSGIVSQESA